MENHKNCNRNLFITLALCFFLCFLFAHEHYACYHLYWKLVVLWVWQVNVCVCLLYELMCNNSHHFPLCLGRHTGITVHQRLSWLWECVGDTVTETLAQTSSGTKRRRECITFIVPAHTACYIQLHAQSTPRELTYHVPQVKQTITNL